MNQTMNKYYKLSMLILADVALINLSAISALLLRFDFEVQSPMFLNFFGVFTKWAFIITVVKLLSNYVMGLYGSLWKFASIDELMRVCVTALFGNVAIFLVMQFFHSSLPRSCYIIMVFLDIIFLGGLRVGYRLLGYLKASGRLRILFNGKKAGKNFSRVLLVGAGSAGASMIKEINANTASGKMVVAVVDDDPAKKGQRIVGKKVAGNRYDIPKLVNSYDIDEIIIAIPTGKRKEIQEIAGICGDTGKKTSILPAYMELIEGKVSISKLRRVDITDLLGRDPVVLDEQVEDYIGGKTVLVTGAGGSIGSELCRQIARKNPERIIALDIYENNLYGLCLELENDYEDVKIESVIVSIQNLSMLEEVFAKFRPHVVFHAAAHKHVPLMEGNPKEALLNNVWGSKNVVDLADKHKVEKFILISTDKAVNPTNIMGATKRVAEMIMQHKSRNSSTVFSAVRFGNVLDSNGSVIPIFKKQIEQGGPVTVTHEEVTRFFMTIPEAVELVIQTGAMAAGGEIFILDMGEAVKIKDLAENLIRLSGYTPYKDIEIVYTGLRPGEKLYEELLLDEEGIKSTSNGRIFVGGGAPPTEALVQILDSRDFETAMENLFRGDEEGIKKWLKAAVPGYKEGESL